MKREMLAPALDALKSLIVDELSSSDEPGRFQRAAKICEHAHKIAQMGAVRVAEAEQDGNALGVDNYGEILANVMGNPGVNRVQQGGMFQRAGNMMNNPDGDFLREIIGVLQHMMAPQAERAAVANLDRMMDLRERLQANGRQTNALDRKIEAALAAMEEEDAVDGAIVLRRPPAGVDGAEGVPAGGEAGNHAGEGGAGEARGDGAQEGVGG